jgi:hypothetical protein
LPITVSSDDVFINCPFDSDYSASFRAIIFAVFACGFRPRTARELDDASYARLSKILDLIAECRFGIHDLSRTELDSEFGLPRFNMPFELGLFIGAKHFGGEGQEKKRVLIFDTESYRYQKFISDLNGMDITAHDGNSSTIVGKVRNWLTNVSRRKISADGVIIAAYNQFAADLPTIATKAGFNPLQIPYLDYEIFVTEWLLNAPLGP